MKTNIRQQNSTLAIMNINYPCTPYSCCTKSVS